MTKAEIEKRIEELEEEQDGREYYHPEVCLPYCMVCERIMAIESEPTLLRQQLAELTEGKNMNIVEAFKIIKADETKCARRIIPNVKNVHCIRYYKKIGFREFNPTASPQREYMVELIEIRDILSDWEVLPIASLNNQLLGE